MIKNYENTNENFDNESSTESISQSFDIAQQAITRMRQDPSFHQSCSAEGIDPITNTDDRIYWHHFRNYVLRKTADGRASGQNETTMDAVDIVASTPAYLIEQQRLTNHQQDNYNDRMYSKRFASHFNQTLRDFAYDNPNTSVNAMTGAMLGAVVKNIPHKAIRNLAAQQIKDVARGAQHELVFGQILVAGGITCRQTTTEEDLRGIDYVVENSNETLNIDVKASLSQIEAKGSGSLFAVDRNKIIMYSMTLDKEFNDRFFIDESSAVNKSVLLSAQLQLAHNAIAKSS